MLTNCCGCDWNEDPERVFERAVQMLRKLAPVAADCGVTLAVETVRPEESRMIIKLPELARLLKAVDHPNVKAALDLTAVIARTVFVPGLTFWGGTILRDRLNLPRPYEQPGFEPLRHKETRGHSFPSRHALSASVLAMVWMYFYPKAGWVMVGITVLICVGRVLTGVHHIRDVVGGAALGFALGFAGMWLL